MFRNKFSIGFEDCENGINAVVNAPILDTNFIVSIDYFDDDRGSIFVDYKCTKTGKSYSVCYFYLKNIIDDYENFLEFLGALESVEKEYKHEFSIVKDICIE